MKFFLTIVMLAIFANIGLTTILDNALTQMQNPNQQQIPQPQRQTDHPNPQQPPSPNDWGEIISGQAQAVGGMGGHSSNPLPDEPSTLPQDIDRETPRGGVGNQEDEKHLLFMLTHCVQHLDYQVVLIYHLNFFCFSKILTNITSYSY